MSVYGDGTYGSGVYGEQLAVVPPPVQVPPFVPDRPLSERGQRMVQSLWPPEQGDLTVIAVMRAGADELDAIQDMMETVREHAWPHQADDTYGLLGVHERTLGLPVAPPGASVAQRQAAVKARMQSRRSGWKSDWKAAMTELLGSTPWTFAENTPAGNQLTITVPYNPDSYTSAQVEALADERTPAHVQIIVAYSQGFIVGVSRVGADPL